MILACLLEEDADDEDATQVQMYFLQIINLLVVQFGFPSHLDFVQYPLLKQ
jgi:hypothetical protein